MKSLITFFALSLSVSSFAASVKSTRDNKVNVARVVKVYNLVEKEDIRVSVAVEDLGGSTDVSPTQIAFLTLYVKGEMYNTDATFKLGQFFKVEGAKRVGAGLYEVSVIDAQLKSKKLKVNAADAIMKIKDVYCEDFSCDDSTKFEATIDVK